MSLNIEVENEALDLYPGEIFTLTFQVTDIINLSGSKAHFSKTIQVPSTETNRQIFGLVHKINSQSTKPYNILACKVIQNGTEILPDGRLVINSSSSEDEFDVTILGGNIDLADRLRNESLNSLDLSDLNFVYIPENAAALADSNTGVVWGVVGYENQETHVYPNSYDVRYGYFGVYVHTIFERIAEKLNAIVEGLEDLQTPPFSELVIPLTNQPKVDQLFQNRRAFSAEASAPVLYDADGLVQFDTIFVGNAGDDYNPASGAYSSAAVFNFNVSYVISGSQTNVSGLPLTFRVKTSPPGTDGGLTGTAWFEKLEVPAGEATFSFEFSLGGLYPGRESVFGLYIELGGVGDTFTLDAGITVTFVATEDAATFQDRDYAADGSLISVARSLPSITVWELVTHIREMYGTIQKSNNIQRKYTILRFEELLNQPAVDWSEKLDTSREDKISFRTPALARKNDFLYRNDEEARTELEADSAFFIDDQNLNVETIIASSVFAASPPVFSVANILTSKITLFEFQIVREGILDQITVSTSLIPYYHQLIFAGETNEGIRFNDFITINGVVTNVVGVPVDGVLQPIEDSVWVYSRIDLQTLVDPLNYVITRADFNERQPRIMQIRESTDSISYENGVIEIPVVNPKVLAFLTPSFGINLGWAQLLEDNYGVFIQRVQQERLLTAYFNLSEADIRNIDFLRPHYVEKYGNFFYLNKIDKYRIDQSTKCDLISLHIGFGGNVITDWFNGWDGASFFEIFSSIRNNIIRAVNQDENFARAITNEYPVITGEEYRLLYNLEYFANYGMNFNAIVSTLIPILAPVADFTIIFDEIISGNENGDYNPATGVYTFADAFTGVLRANMSVFSGAGGGGSTVEMFSSVQGVLDSVNIPNNSTLNFTLTDVSAHVAGETIVIRITTNQANINEGSSFSFVWQSGGTLTNIEEITAGIVDDPTNAELTTPKILEAGVREQTFKITGASSSNAVFIIQLAGVTDFSLDTRLIKISNG